MVILDTEIHLQPDRHTVNRNNPCKSLTILHNFHSGYILFFIFFRLPHFKNSSKYNVIQQMMQTWPHCVIKHIPPHLSTTQLTLCLLFLLLFLSLRHKKRILDGWVEFRAGWFILITFFYSSLCYLEA